MNEIGIDRELFLQEVSYKLFNHNISDTQKTGINIILDFWEKPAIQNDNETVLCRKWSCRSDEWLSYILGTVYHETYKRMTPCAEQGSYDYFQKCYENNKEIGNIYRGDGYTFRARGYIHIPGRTFYRKITPILQKFYNYQVDLEKTPEALEKLKPALIVLFYGMIEGCFTGRGLLEYMPKGMKPRWYSARRIINDYHNAKKVKIYSIIFNNALKFAKRG